MRKADIRHGAEFWMLPFVLSTWLLPLNLLFIFFLPNQLMGILLFTEPILSMILGLIVSLIPFTKRFLSKYFAYDRVKGKQRLKFWDYIGNYGLIIITINHPILLVLLSLLLE